MDPHHDSTRFSSRRRVFGASRNLVVLVALFVPWGCSKPAGQAAGAAVRPTYDKSSGKLNALEYDSDKDGRMDTWVDMDGTRPLRSRADLNGDGKVDRWEYYDEQGSLLKVGFSRRDTGTADAWAYSGPGGGMRLVEISSVADESRIDRWEHYDGGRRQGDSTGVLVRAEEDTNGDGRPDKWETYERGAVKTVAFDETGNGMADRRLTYEGGALVLIESQPDASGRFVRRAAVR